MKYISSTYLKNVTNYSLKLFYDNKKDYCIVVKKINKIDFPFILEENGKKVTIIDNGFYILEYIPYNENYICRIHIDKTKEIIERFFIASKENKIINFIPTYFDLKLSLVYIGNNLKLYNSDIIDELMKRKEITIDDYHLAFKTIEKLKKEIINNNNFICNLNYSEYLDNWEV